jgi:hypothetical protein
MEELTKKCIPVDVKGGLVYTREGRQMFGGNRENPMPVKAEGSWAICGDRKSPLHYCSAEAISQSKVGNDYYLKYKEEVKPGMFIGYML